jgi:PAS domain S-box-containing protein
MAEMVGCTAEEMVGMSLYDFIEEEARPIMRKNLELRREGISQNYDFEFVTRDGSKIQTYLAAAPMVDGDGNFLGSHAGVLDISERKQMERALRESVMLYKTQFETSPDGVTLTDLDGTIVSASRRSAEMLGYGSPQDLLGMNSLDLIAPEQRQWAEENLLTTLDTGFVRGMEYEMLRKDGSRFIGGLSEATLRDENRKRRNATLPLSTWSSKVTRTPYRTT